MNLVITILLLRLLAGLSPRRDRHVPRGLGDDSDENECRRFLISWSVSLVLLFSISYEVGGTRAAQQGGGHTALDVVKILLGLGLVFAAGQQKQRRGKLRTSSGFTRNLTGLPQRLNRWQAAIGGVLKPPWAITQRPPSS